MDGKKIALLVGALFVAAVTAIMAKNMFGTAGAPVVSAAMAPSAPLGPQVLVAAKPLPVGTILGPDSVTFQPWPKTLVDGAYYVRGAPDVDPAKMIGMVVRSEITAGQPVTQGSLVSPQDRGFLAAALTPGMRAVTVSVGGASAVAGFVFPGDRVDLMLTQTVQGSGGDGTGQSLNATETIVRNARVLATDQRFDNQPTPDGKTQISQISMVTLEATPKLAEEIAVAQKLGSLSLSLRPLADNNEDLEKAVAVGDIKVPAGTDPAIAKKTLLDLASRPQDGKSTFTTGGEVSRFARTSIPKAGTQVALAGGAPGAQMAAPTVPTGPVVHIARGNTVTDTPVGGK